MRIWKDSKKFCNSLWTLNIHTTQVLLSLNWLLKERRHGGKRARKEEQWKVVKFPPSHKRIQVLLTGSGRKHKKSGQIQRLRLLLGRQNRGDNSARAFLKMVPFSFQMVEASKFWFWATRGQSSPGEKTDFNKEHSLVPPSRPQINRTPLKGKERQKSPGESGWKKTCYSPKTLLL